MSASLLLRPDSGPVADTPARQVRANRAGISVFEAFSAQLTTMFLRNRRTAADGHSPAEALARTALTKRQMEVLRLLGEGKTNNEIAQALFSLTAHDQASCGSTSEHVCFVPLTDISASTYFSITDEVPAACFWQWVIRESRRGDPWVI